MPHGHFSTNKRRLKKTWEVNKQNENNNENLKKSIVKFESVNFSKENVKIPLITDKVFDANTDFFYTTTFTGFPEDSINFFKPMAIWSVPDAYNVDNILSNSQFNQKLLDESLKVGDIIVIASQLDYWYNKVDNTNTQLRLHYNINIREITSYTPGGGFSTSAIPVTMNIFMQGVNEKIYENVNQ